MNDVQDKVLDDQKSDYADLESLLDAAKSSEFNLSDGFTEEKKEFEKLSSFFEIVTSKEQKEPTSWYETNEFSNNDFVDDSDGTEEKQESPEVSKSDEVENLDKLDPIEEGADAASKEKSADYNNQSILDDTQDDIENGDPLENLENQQNIESTEADVSEGQPSFSEEEQLAYDMGYKEALEEFEKAMLLEKNSFKDLTDTMFSVGEDFQESLQELIKTKICQISSELLDDEIKEFSPPLLKKIKKAADNILSEVKDFTLELNHADLELLNGNEAAESLGFELIERSDLRRGEFRLISNSTGFQQKLSH